jgi:hypothetical protein
LRQEGDDVFEWWVMNRSRPGMEPALQQCTICHSGGGINSLNSRAHLLRPNGAQPDPNEVHADRPREAATQWWAGDNNETIDWKHDRYDWGLLNGYWRSNKRLH